MKRRRRGYTLTELLVVIVLTSTLLGTMTVTLYSLNQANRRIRDDLSQDIQVLRLTESLRSDLHQASDIALEPLSEGLSVTANDHTMITYTTRDGCIERQFERGGQVVGSDQFWLPPCSAAWQIDRNRDAPIVALTLSLPATPNGDPVAGTIRIVAACLPGVVAAPTGE